MAFVGFDFESFYDVFVEQIFHHNDLEFLVLESRIFIWMIGVNVTLCIWEGPCYQ